MSRTPDQYALARKLLASGAEALVTDEWSGPATRTDIVARPSRGRPAPLPLPDPEDPTTRMSPDRVLALLKAELIVPEPLEPTPGHTPTRVFDPDEVSIAQKESVEPPASDAKPSSRRAGVETKSSPRAKPSPDNKQPFEVMESVPARPPRAPAVPFEFATAQAASPPPRSNRRALKRRIKRALGLVAMAVAVFMTTFLLTKGLRDEAARVRAWEFINGLGARVGSWFSSQAEPPKPKTSSNVLSLRAEPKPAPAALAPAAAPAAASSTPVVRLEDLAVLEGCSGPDCPSSQAKSASKQRRAVRTRAP